MPSNRYFQQFLFSLIRRFTVIQGVVSIAADASVVSSTSIKGATVTKTGTGQYTITLDNAYVAVSSVECTMEAATAVDLVPQVVSADVAGAKTVVVKLLTGAIATDPSAVCKLHVSIFMRDSTVV